MLNYFQLFIAISLIETGVFFLFAQQIANDINNLQSPDTFASQLKYERQPVASTKYDTKLTIGENAILMAEIANTPEARSIGLSSRANLPENYGMLFVFQEPAQHSFWMKGMRFPIDILWIENEIIADITKYVPIPTPRQQLDLYTPKVPVTYVLEVNAGWADAYNIKVGDNVFGGPFGKKPKNAPSVALNNDTASVLIPVPFTSQAPFGEWSNPRYQDACEEASVLMAARWLEEKNLNKEEAQKEILALSYLAENFFGAFEDSSAEDTARLLREYFPAAHTQIYSDIGIENIKIQLKNGNLVIVPVNGQMLGNPHFTPPGPVRHMLVIIGYDEKGGKFITNDPGTRYGKQSYYAYQVLFDAIRDYSTGNHEPITKIEKKMIVVSK